MSGRNDKPPDLRRHKATNRARIRVRGRDIYGPDWGRRKSPTKRCEEWYLDLLTRWGAAEGVLPEVGRPTVASAVLSASDPARSLTVAELAVRYIDLTCPQDRYQSLN